MIDEQSGCLQLSAVVIFYMGKEFAASAVLASGLKGAYTSRYPNSLQCGTLLLSLAYSDNKIRERELPRVIIHAHLKLNLKRYKVSESGIGYRLLCYTLKMWQWFCSVMASTRDSDSRNLGSTPSRT